MLNTIAFAIVMAGVLPVTVNSPPSKVIVPVPNGPLVMLPVVPALIDVTPLVRVVPPL